MTKKQTANKTVDITGVYKYEPQTGKAENLIE